MKKIEPETAAIIGAGGFLATVFILLMWNKAPRVWPSVFSSVKVGDTFADLGGADPWCAHTAYRVIEIKGDYAKVIERTDFNLKDKIDTVPLKYLGGIMEADNTGCFEWLDQQRHSSIRRKKMRP